MTDEAGEAEEELRLLVEHQAVRRKRARAREKPEHRLGKRDDAPEEGALNVAGDLHEMGEGFPPVARRLRNIRNAAHVILSALPRH